MKGDSLHASQCKEWCSTPGFNSTLSRLPPPAVVVGVIAAGACGVVQPPFSLTPPLPPQQLLWG